MEKKLISAQSRRAETSLVLWGLGIPLLPSRLGAVSDSLCGKLHFLGFTWRLVDFCSLISSWFRGAGLQMAEVSFAVPFFSLHVGYFAGFFLNTWDDLSLLRNFAASRGDAPSAGAWEVRCCDEPMFLSLTVMERFDRFQYFR